MRNFCKTIAVLIAAALTFGLAACSGSGGGDNSPQSPTQAPAAETRQEAAVDDTVSASDLESQPAAEETPSATAEAAGSQGDGLTADQRSLMKYDPPVTVSFARNVDPNAIFAPGQDYENNVWMTEYRDVLGINLVTAWEAQGLVEYDEKMNLSISSGTIPDMFQVNMGQLMSLINGGRLTDLNWALDNYVSDFFLASLYADGGTSMEQSTMGGKLYSLPRDGVTEGSYQYMLIRDDWRKALNLPEPTTLDDVLKMARAFIDADLDGQNAYGIAISNAPWETWFAMRGAFNIFGAYSKTWIERDGKLVYGEVQPEMKFALANMRSWFEQGLLDPELATKSSWDVSVEAIAGRVGIAFGEGWLLGWPLPDGMRIGHEWRAYQIPFHPDNAEQKYASKSAINGGYVVSNRCENPEALIKMCNLFQERVMTGNYDILKYKGDDQFTYEFLAAFTPNNGPDRNLLANRLINAAIDTGDTSKFTMPEQIRWFEEVRDYKNGITRIEFKPDPEGDEVEIYEIDNQTLLAYIRGQGVLSFETSYDNDILSQMVSKYVGNFNNFWGRYGRDSTYGIDTHMKENNMFMRDKYIGPPTESMQLYQGQLDSDFNEVAVNIVVGAENIDFFDVFVADWYRNGGQAITDEVNEWYAQR